MTSYPTNSQKDTRTQFEQIVLLLQGGGALGSYQAGVYQALAEADLHPNWVAGISIGAINAAIIAGNAPDKPLDDKGAIVLREKIARDRPSGRLDCPRGGLLVTQGVNR